jgi:hypothetical protein
MSLIFYVYQSRDKNFIKRIIHGQLDQPSSK